MRVLEVLLVHCGDAGSTEDEVAFGDDIVGGVDVHGGFDLADDGVEGRVDTEGLADGVVEDGALAEFFVGEGCELFAENTLLLFEKGFDKFRVVGNVEKHPGNSSHRGVLSGHKLSLSLVRSNRSQIWEPYQCNHHVRNISIINLAPILVCTIHQIPHHVRVCQAISFGLTPLL